MILMMPAFCFPIARNGLVRQSPRRSTPPCVSPRNCF